MNKYSSGIEMTQSSGDLLLEKSDDSKESFSADSFSTGQLWGALRKTWKAYKIAKSQNNLLAMMKYGDRIRSLQSKLGLSLSRFPEVGLN
jgi:hypothetical protein